MRLKDRKASPIGGFSYDDPLTDRVIVSQGSFDTLVREVRQWQAAQGITSPAELEQIIENQICDRQPASKCWKRGLGDLVAGVVQKVAGAVDAVAGTNLKKKAKRCGGCSKRRVMLNS
jgi:hypothetical protein